MILVATSDSRAYYKATSRLKDAGLEFRSLNPNEVRHQQFDLILTTKNESGAFHGKVIAIEELDLDLTIMKGQIISILSGKESEFLIGIDPGSRIGLAAYYGNSVLAGLTFNSVDGLRLFMGRFVERVPGSSIRIKIGDGSPKVAAIIAETLARECPKAGIEIVDERGTSVRSENGGLRSDQNAAARIAFRKGVPYLRSDHT